MFNFLWRNYAEHQRLPLRSPFIVVKTFNVAPANEPWQCQHP
jgi:hypothetical protein